MGRDDTIVFAPASTDQGLFRVTASGGIPKPLTFLDRKKGERSHRWPRFLPDGRHVLFTIDDWGANYATKRVAVVDVTTGQSTTLVEGGCDARFMPGGFLIFARDRALYAVKFDPDELRVSGLPVPILDRVATHVGLGFAFFDFSSDGTLLYEPVDPASTSLELVSTDRKGVSTPLSRRRGEFLDPVLSPDGQQLVVGIGESRATDLWLVNIDRDSWSRIAPEGQSLAPVWSPRGDRIFYSSNRAGTYNIYSMPANGEGPATQITNREYWPFTRSVSADGRTLIMEVQDPVTSNDLWLVDVATHKESPLLTSRANEMYGVMSPDGHWFAYASNETGTYEVYVQHLPPTGRKWSVSENGGILPRWSGDGREIFFRNYDKVMVAPVRTQPALVIGAPKQLFEVESRAYYDVSRDAHHFVMLREKNHPAQLSVVLNWFEDVRRRIAVAYDRHQ